MNLSLDQVNIYPWIKANLRNKAFANLGSKKMPFFLAKVKSVDVSKIDPGCILLDKQARVHYTTIHKQARVYTTLQYTHMSYVLDQDLYIYIFYVTDPYHVFKKNLQISATYQLPYPPPLLFVVFYKKKIYIFNQGEVAGSMLRQVLENYGSYIQPGSVVALKDVTVLVTSKTEYVIITLENIVSIYCPKQGGAACNNYKS